MTFTSLKFSRAADKATTATITYMEPAGRGKYSGRKRPDAKPELVITIAKTITGELAEEPFSLLLGQDDHRGKIRIATAPHGQIVNAVNPSPTFRSYRFYFGHVPALGEDHFERERCAVRKIADGVFEIDVPESWFDLSKE